MNSSFSQRNPLLQLAIDSHSLGAFKICPRWYYYTIVRGLRPRVESVHLTFGLLLHKVHETYHQHRAQGLSHEEALEETVALLLELTFNKALRRPWASEDPQKNRATLLRTAVWYLDKFQDDPLRTISLSDGSAAVELHFAFDSGFATSEGERFLFVGWIDRLGELNGWVYIPDVKTTKQTLRQSWFEKFSPFNQFSMYALAGKIAFKQDVEGVIVDGVQIAAGFSRFERQPIQRPPAIIEEWHKAQQIWLKQMEEAATAGRALEEAGKDPSEAWPMNDTSCDRYGGCPARAICSRAPAAREQWLEKDFTFRGWDPLAERTDI